MNAKSVTLMALKSLTRRLDQRHKPPVDEFLVQIPPLQERVLDAAVVDGVDVAAVDVVFAGVDDDGAGDGELFVDELAGSRS